MKYQFYMVLLILTACTTKESGMANKRARPLTIKDFKLPDPDIATERNKILSYFERHKHQDVFDTADRTYADWWGLWRSSVNSVTAGYLFSKEHIHAILYYVIEPEDAVLEVHLKTGEVWKKIFADSTIDPSKSLVLEDWNQDGTKDLSLRHMPNMVSTKMNYDLYLVDKTGMKIQPVPGFWELRTPRTDTISRIITTKNQYRNMRSFGMYSFTGTEINEIQTINIYSRWNYKKDDTVTIWYFRKSDRYKETITSEGDIDRHLPEPVKRRMAEQEED